MNDGEVPLVLKLLGLPHGPADDLSAETLTDGARALLAEFPLELVCITMGGSGSLLVDRKRVDRHPGIRCVVADTVGAGDAFTAALAHYYLQGASLAVMNEAGNRWGSWTASQRGAMPTLGDREREEIAAAIDRTAI
jgi:fructokinase